jgi:hypothetical protein
MQYKYTIRIEKETANKSQWFTTDYKIIWTKVLYRKQVHFHQWQRLFNKTDSKLHKTFLSGDNVIAIFIKIIKMF